MTKSERNKHYRHALVAFEKGKSEFICNQLGYEIGNYIQEENLQDVFPELAKRKPKVILAPTSEGGWWPVSDRNIRIKVLKQCIKETSPKTKK